MFFKSYFAANVEAALSRAAQELGPDAMLVQSRRASPEMRRLGEYEVVFAADDALKTPAPAKAEEPAAPPAAPLAMPSRNASPEPDARLSSEIAELRRQLERMAVAVSRSSLVALSQTAPTQEASAVFASLIASEVDPELAHDILNNVRQVSGPSDPLRVRRALAAELEKRFTVNSQLGRGDGQKVVAFIGPPGGGKTTTLVKLAVQCGLKARRPTAIISADNHRVAAEEQLRSYAHILGVSFAALDSAASLPNALEEFRHKDLILIDTPGLAAEELDSGADLARILASSPAIDTHLVLPASMKAADLARTVDRYAHFGPRKLLFTKLDETEAFGPLLNESARAQLPLSFLANGQQVPEHIQPATKQRILDLLITEQVIAAAAAAA